MPEEVPRADRGWGPRSARGTSPCASVAQYVRLDHISLAPPAETLQRIPGRVLAVQDFVRALRQLIGFAQGPNRAVRVAEVDYSRVQAAIRKPGVAGVGGIHNGPV